jgi:TatD DNase family protein
MELFASQLEEAKRRDLPVIIHTREAFEDTLALLKEIPSRGVIHCFTGTPEEAEAYLDLGFYISISGIVTFRAADNVRKSALVVPPERILIETDAPFLAPVPMRGKANEPAFIVHTCEFLAKLRGMDVEEFAALTYANGERAFS